MTLLLLLVFFSPPSWASRGPTLHSTRPLERTPWTLSVGEQKVIEFPELEKFSLGNSCVRARPHSHSSSPSKKDILIIKAVCSTSTTLWVLKRDGSSEIRQIHVEKSPIKPSLPLLLRALEPLEETEIFWSGELILLQGEISDLGELTRIHHLSESFPKNIQNRTFPSDALIASQSSALQTFFKATPAARQLRIEQQGHALIIRGSLETPAIRAEIESQIRILFPPALLEIECLPDRGPTVSFRVFLLEVKKDRLHSLGMSWPSSTPVLDAGKIELSLRALEGDGSLRLLSRPELVVRVPGEAELFSGGEFPVIVKTRNQTLVNWKNFGLSLKLNVSQAAGNRVRLDLSTEISHLDPALTIDEIPGVQANRLKTQIDAHYGVPLFLSGLLREETRTQARGLPGMRNIPLLGKLFGSEDFLEDRSELVVVLLPQLVPQDSLP